MLKKSLAIILSTALALGVLVQGSFAYTKGPSTDLESLVESVPLYPTFPVGYSDILDWFSFHGADLEGYLYCTVSVITSGSQVTAVGFMSTGKLYDIGGSGRVLYSTTNDDIYFCMFGWRSNFYTGTLTPSNNTRTVDGVSFYQYNCSWADSNLYNGTFYANYSIEGNTITLVDLSNLDATGYVYNPDTRFMDVYMSGSTYGNVRYLCVEVDDIILSSSWISVRYLDQFGPGTYIQDYPFDFFTSYGHSYVKIMPNLISDYEFTVTSVLFSGSTSWGIKELTGLDLTFNEDFFPTPIPSAYPVPDYSYYDTTYINYNGGSSNVVYTPLSTHLIYGHTDSDPLISYFEDYHQLPSQNVSYLVQPFSFSYIVIPAAARLNGQYYDDFLDDAIYQYDVVLDNLVFHNNPNDFDLFYGSGAWSDLTSLLAASLQNGQLDVSPVLDAWYSSHDPLLLQSPFYSNGEFVLVDYTGECSMILTDSFFFKQTNYLIGDTSDILTELSERFFKVDGFSDSLFQNLSSLYNLNLQYYDSSLQALTGLSYWLNDNDISSNFSDIYILLSSVDNYLSSVDSKLDLLNTIDSDLGDLLEWFRNQEDSDVLLNLPEFNPSVLIEVYGQNVGDLVGFFQEFIDVLPSFDFSDFPNFFDYAADLVDDVAGQDDDIMNDLFQPYDYSDSGLHDFGWD